MRMTASCPYPLSTLLSPRFTLLLLFILSLSPLTSYAQNITSSPLPIILIQTDINPATGQPYDIPDDPKIGATMKILYVNDSTINYLSNQDSTPFLHYVGRIAIERRGTTSQDFSKKPYGFETRMADNITNRNVSLLGMPEENDWVLNALNGDHSYLRDCLSYALGRRTGHYAPRTKYCEVFVNGNYRGVYYLTERIKIDDGRVNIAKLDTTDNTLPALSGGYIIKADKLTGGDVPAWTTPAYNYYEDVNYIYHNPKPELITPAQGTYIHNYFNSLQTATNAGNSSLSNGYPSLIDIPSFVDYMIVGELSSNVDIYQKSTFFYKDRLGKLCAGPLWDFNYAYGSDIGTSWGNGRSGYNVWQFDNNDNTGSYFWYQLFHDSPFQCQFARRWHQLTDAGGPLCYDSVCAIIDSLQAVIDPVVSRDKQRWSYRFSHTQDINSMKQWLQQRYSWINSQLGSYSGCDNPDLPLLVISKIHYHPATTSGYTEKKLEFLGITNADTVTLDLTGIYLRELGLSYQFASGDTLAPGEELYLASDSAAFRAIYGVSAHDEFARHLSNHSQRLVLADGWGNAIDDVTYSDQAPWPIHADGDGPFLLLTDPTTDNSLAQNWTIGTMLQPLHLYDTLHFADTLHTVDSLVLGDTLFLFDTLFFFDTTLFVHTTVFNTDTTIIRDTVAWADTLATTDTIVRHTPIGILLAETESIRVFPVPATDFLTVCSDGALIQRVELFSPTGQRLRTLQADAYSLHLSLQDLSTGLYMLRITTTRSITVRRIEVCER